MQVSAKHISRQSQAKLVGLLSTLLADCKQPSEVTQFLQDFLSETELSVLSKRLAIAWRLHQGKSYQAISQELGVSSATISTVAELLEKKGLQLACAKLSTDQWAEQQLSKLSKFLGR